MSNASTTALMTSLIRAVHTRRDPAPLFHDPYGDRFIDAAERSMLLQRFLAMLGEADRARLGALDDPAEALDLAAAANPAYGGVVVRSRWTEDRLIEAIGRGVRQYVIVGAGFDSFAFRRPAAAAAVHVVEVDTEATLAMKRQRADAAGLRFGDRSQLVAADLERDGLGRALSEVPHGHERMSFVSCLGVLPYLTDTGVRRMLHSIAASVAVGSEVVFDYLEPAAVATGSSDPELQRVRRALAAAGEESWRSGLTPDTLPAQLAAVGLTLLEDLDGALLQARYGSGRALSVPRRMHVARARVTRA